VEDRIGDGDIYVIAANGTGEQRLTAHPADDGDPSWSPDGAKIVFTSRRDGNGLYIMDRDGRNIRRVTDGGEFRGIEGSSWYDPDAPRSVSPVARRATMWGWLRAVDARAHRAEALRSRRP
jgi:dipeptidyl aminopeptidase/acylaminoacyl peptidase